MSNENPHPGLYTTIAPVVMFGNSVVVAKAYQNKGEPNYFGKFGIEIGSQDYTDIKATAARVARAKWPGRDLKTLAFPFKDGNKLADEAKARKEDREAYRGKLIVTASSKFAPALATLKNGALTDLLSPEQIQAASSDFYIGVEVLVVFHFVTKEKDEEGVKAYLQRICSLNRGVRLGKRSAAEVFKGYVGTISAEDPTTGAGTGLDDDIPF